MTRVLAYCAFRRNPAISIPATGVNGAALNVLHSGDLSLLWSEIQWPLDSAALRRNAVEFHAVITRAFDQTAVAPFRLLTVFDSEQSLGAFAAKHAKAFVADLERLDGRVQMECVVFFKMMANPDRSSGQAYLRQKAELRHAVDQHIASLSEALAPIAQEIRVREVNSGARLFCLLQTDRQSQFHSRARALPAPPGVELRFSGPWPAAEFLSDAVKTPEMASQQQRS